jgi:hypothetical protein
MDQLQRIESKLDALLKSAGVTWEEPAPPAPPELSEAQKQALANAPVVKVAHPEGSRNAGLVFTGVPAPAEPVSEEQRAAQRAQALANAPVVKVPGGEASGSGYSQPSGETDEMTVPPTDPPAVPKRR